MNNLREKKKIQPFSPLHFSTEWVYWIGWMLTYHNKTTAIIIIIIKDACDVCNF